MVEPRGGGSDGARADAFGAELARWLSDAAADAAAAERSQSRLLRQAAEEEATFVGVAVDLAERAARVVVRTSSGRSHRGVLLAVGRDFVVVREPGGDGAPAFVSLAAVTTIRPQPSGGGSALLDASGSRAAPRDASLAAVLATLAVERPRVQVGLAGGGEEPLAGELRSVGLDVLTLRLDGDAGRSAHVRLGAVAEVLLLDG
jgi:hypothetical protein